MYEDVIELFTRALRAERGPQPEQNIDPDVTLTFPQPAHLQECAQLRRQLLDGHPRVPLLQRQQRVRRQCAGHGPAEARREHLPTNMDG